MSNFSYNDELYHHGVKGQKWGVRRYQNEDGTLTEEGKQRYGTGYKIKDKSKRSKNPFLGRKINASLADRKERGDKLRAQNRTTVGAYGRGFGRAVVNGLVTDAASGALSVAILSGASVAPVLAAGYAIAAASFGYSVSSAIRTWQDASDIETSKTAEYYEREYGAHKR